MVILDPELEERTIAPSLDRFLTVITKSNGTVGKVDIWGRRRLAYEIKKQIEGIYAVIDIDAEPAAVAELDRQLNLNESVLRTKLMRPEVHCPWPASPSPPSSATCPPPRSCASRPRAPPSPTSPWRRRRAPSTASRRSGRTARRCSSAA